MSRFFRTCYYTTIGSMLGSLAIAGLVGSLIGGDAEDGFSTALYISGSLLGTCLGSSLGKGIAKAMDMAEGNINGETKKLVSTV